MEKDEYDLKTDNLAIGHALADYRIKRYGSIENTPRLIHKKESPLEILSQTNPKELKNFGSGKVFDRLFKKIAKTGYEIKDTSRMDGSQKWGYYISLMKEFSLLGNLK